MSLKNSNPVIVVVAYNRLNSLKRLLGSLEKAHYPENTRLLISIDSAYNNPDVVNCAREFEWISGEKEVITHSENMGLKKHIISCGDLTQKYGSVIILEDDLFVSPFFYDYAVQALEYYHEDEEISGIGLFNYRHIEKIKPEPFNPVVDNSDVYFIQYACSSGQLWSQRQWGAFRKWYDPSPVINDIAEMPKHVMYWPERSWKKYFIAYLISHKRFFVYPRVSLTSNFDDVGTNRSLSTFEVQSILLLERKSFSFKTVRDSLAVYDAHFEILPEKLLIFNKNLQAYDFAVDLYGNKVPSRINKDFLITTKKCKSYVLSYSRSLRPHEMNLIMNVKGNDIFLCNKSELVKPDKKDRINSFVSNFNYHYRTSLTINELILFFKYWIYKKLIRIKNRLLN